MDNLIESINEILLRFAEFQRKYLNEQPLATDGYGLDVLKNLSQKEIDKINYDEKHIFDDFVNNYTLQINNLKNDDTIKNYISGLARIYFENRKEFDMALLQKMVLVAEIIMKKRGTVNIYKIKNH